MKTIRRLYFYLVAIISLEVVVWGVISLLRSIINGKDVINGTETLAQALALIFVGVPIFLFHWLWSQNTSAKDEEEKTASLRAIFLYGALLATLIPAIQNLFALINRTFLSTARLSAERAIIGGSQSLTDNILAILINLLIAAYFWNILRNEWKTLHDTENFSEIRRLYRFIWMLYGLLMVVYGAQQALNFAFTLSTDVLGGIGRETIVNAIALLGIGTPIWYFSWRILQDVLPDPGEKESVLRLGILYLLALGGVITTLTAGGNLLYILLRYLFGETSTGVEFLKKIGNPISIGIPFGVMWAYFGFWLNQQFSFDESTLRRAGKKRIYFYILSAIGLTVSVIGLATLFTFIINISLNNTYLGEDSFRSTLAGSLSALFVGLPLWLLTWRPLQAEALGESDLNEHARRSIIRRSYLYLALFAGVIGGMVSAVILIFTLINTLLGGGTSVAKNALDSLTILILFVVLLLYHLSVLRKDGASRSDAFEAKQQDFKILVFDHGDGKFGDSVKTAFAKQGLKVSVQVVNINEPIPADVKSKTIILPMSLAMNTPKNVEAWLRSFDGSRLIVNNDEAAGVFWMNDLEQAAASVQTLTEGQELRPQSSTKGTSAWTYVAYVFAALFACELLFVLSSLAIALVTGAF